jgi:MOSC domain-containing protein
VRFRIGEVNFEDSNPCARCPVPPRDPRTGKVIPDFQKRYSDFRCAHIPSWAPESRFDHYYRPATNTCIAPSESGKILHLSDLVVLL